MIEKEALAVIWACLGVCYDTDIDYGQFEYVEIRCKKEIKDKCDRNYRTAKLSKLVPGQTVYVKTPSDKGSKELVIREDNSPNSY